MKNTTLLLFLFLQTTLFAQINGNKNIITKNFPLESLSKLEINLSANIIIDTKAESGISITTDENMFEHIHLSPKNGYLDLTQLKWIEPSGNHLVVIGAPNLEAVELDAHSYVEIKNLDQTTFQVKGNVGRIVLKGSVDQLDLNVKLAKVDAMALEVRKANVRIRSWGKVSLGEVEELDAEVDESGELKTLNKPQQLTKHAEEVLARPAKVVDDTIRFIDFKIKNNAEQRNHFYVVGPKQDGSRFSYGFPMNPGQVRTKTWTVGTKLYKVNKRGRRKLVTTIKAEDEGKVVDIFRS